MWKRFSCVCASAATLTILLPHPASAAWPTDPTTNLPLCTATGNQYSPAIISDGAGGAIVTWYDGRNGAYDIYAQHVLASGAVDPTWPGNGRAVCTASGDQQYPKLVGDGAGGAIVTWHDGRSGTNVDIYAQHVRASGTVDPAWPGDGQALCTATGNQQYPTIVTDGAGGAIVAWYDRRNGSNYDIYAQRVLASGAVDSAWPTDGRALCTAANDQYSPIVADGVGGAILTWYDYRSGTDYDIYAQHVLTTGVADPSWPANGRATCTATGDQYSPTLIADGAGGAIVAWYDNRGSADYDIYAQHVLASGAVDGAWPGNGRAVCTAVGDQQYPRLVGDGSGGVIVTWQDSRDGTGVDIYAQHVLASGAVDAAWPANGRALCTASSDQESPTIVGDGAAGAIVAWYDIRNGSNYDIYAQRVLASGAVDPAWPGDGRAVCTASGSQSAVATISDGAGGAIVAWQDLRNGSDYGIYAQRVQMNGQLGGGTVSVPDNAPFAIALDPIRPNPWRGAALDVRFTLATPEAASLELLDVSGRLIREREVGSLGAGRHDVDLGEGRQPAPGIYLVRLQQGASVRVTRVAVLD